MDEKPTPPEEKTDNAGDQDTQVKVTDRRKFDKDGRLRTEAMNEEVDDNVDAGEPEPEPRVDPGEPAASAGAGPAAAQTGQSASQAPPAPGAGSERGRGVDFQSFVYFLYMSALHELGVPTDQGAPPAQPDLERARFFIDVLHVLEEKTRGNLQPGEAKLLEDVLYNLRMQYVGLAQQNTPT